MRRRILFLVHRVPYPPDKGDRIRSYHLLAHLSRLGDVDLAFLHEGPVGRGTLGPLEGLCRRVEGFPVSSTWRWARAFSSLARGRSLTEGLFDSPAMRDRVSQWIEETEYDAVVCFSSAVLPYVLAQGLDSRLVVDMVDVDSQKWFDYARRAVGPKAALFECEGRRVRLLERRAGRSRAVVLATEPEAAIYRGICPETRVEAIVNGVDLDYFRPEVATNEGDGCVFVGQLDYHANIIGLQWFCREVWPMIRSSRPDATLRLVGRNPSPAIRRLDASPGVEVVGTVADVRPYLASARIVLVPLPVARGVQNKVLEAMAMGRPVVASLAALEGLALEEGRHALAAADPGDWIRIIDRIWDDDRGRADLGNAARLYVEENHRWETCLAPFNAFVDDRLNASNLERVR